MMRDRGKSRNYNQREKQNKDDDKTKLNRR